MNTGQEPSVTYDLKVGADRKTQINVDACDLMTQSSSGARGGRMDLKNGEVNPLTPEDPSEN